MKKIKKEIRPTYCSYKWFGKYYGKKPLFTVVRYYLVDEYSDIEARLRFRFLILPILAIVVCYLLYITVSQVPVATIQLPDYMTVNNDVLSVDANNVGEYPATVKIYEEVGDKRVVWLEEEVLPRSSISNVSIAHDFNVGERTVKVNIVVESGNKQSSYTNDMIVRVLN